MTTNVNSGTSGLSLLGVLQVVFIVLKILKIINWGWLKVFIPSFIELGIMFVVLIGMLIYCKLN